MILTESHKVYKLFNSNPLRQRLIIANYTDSNLYILPREDPDPYDFINNGFRLKYEGILEVDDYKGGLWCVTDVASTEVRAMEFRIGV